MSVRHPYYPTDIFIANFKENDKGMFNILAGFFGGIAGLLLVLAGTAFRGYKASVARKLALVWLLLSGCIHVILEGHFCVYHADIASRMDFLSQVCK